MAEGEPLSAADSLTDNARTLLFADVRGYMVFTRSTATKPPQVGREVRDRSARGRRGSRRDRRRAPWRRSAGGVRLGPSRQSDSLDDGELSTPRKMDIDPETILYSPGEILAHVMLHGRQHHGDLNTLLHQLGLDIAIVEYRFSLPERDA